MRHFNLTAIEKMAQLSDWKLLVNLNSVCVKKRDSESGRVVGMTSFSCTKESSAVKMYTILILSRQQANMDQMLRLHEQLLKTGGQKTGRLVIMKYNFKKGKSEEDSVI